MERLRYEQSLNGKTIRTARLQTVRDCQRTGLGRLFAFITKSTGLWLSLATKRQRAGAAQERRQNMRKKEKNDSLKSVGFSGIIVFPPRFCRLLLHPINHSSGALHQRHIPPYSIPGKTQNLHTHQKISRSKRRLKSRSVKNA